ncbi:sigma-70 family RNA polymerase sigma factor [Vibrio crassostreae]|uniref:sigma-70 family RNA polymerase sigma factor n=1 Tax=Vibrio crassostreae TaxID=246167 RepID=UPI001B307341|nr:sigma-70 family RNA polymerase sigma factor [Vibrio crassostreae]
MLDYENIIKRHKPVSPEVEKELLEQYAETKCSSLANRIALANIRYIAKVVRTLKHSNLQFDDLMQEGVIGFLESLPRYDASKGASVRSYATDSIRYGIFNAIISQADVVKTATTHEKRKLFFNLRKFQKPNKNSLTVAEKQHISNTLSVSIKDIEAMEIAQSMVFDPIYDGTQSIESEESGFVELPSLDTVDENLVCNEDDMRLKRVYESIEVLTPRQSEILKRRWVAEEKEPLRVIAEDLGISMERVRQVEKQALMKIKEHVTLN